MRQKLCHRLETLEQVNAAALAAVRDREIRAAAAAGLEELRNDVLAWRAENSGPEHANESLFDTLARACGMSSQELQVELRARASRVGEAA